MGVFVALVCSTDDTWTVERARATSVELSHVMLNRNTAQCYVQRGIATASCLSVCLSVRDVEV